MSDLGASLNNPLLFHASAVAVGGGNVMVAGDLQPQEGTVAASGGP